jgi:hypothetical protein
MLDRIAAIVLAVVLVATTLHGDCSGSSLQRRDVDRFPLRASRIEALDAAFAQIDTNGAALSAPNHQRRLSLNPTPAEEIRYLKPLAGTQRQLDGVYELGSGVWELKK